jgi:DnaK suppressor protein
VIYSAALVTHTVITNEPCARRYSEKVRCAIGAVSVSTLVNRLLPKGGLSMITMEEQLFLKQLMLGQLEELQRKADGTVSDLLLLSIHSADELDTSAMDADRSFTLRIRDRESKLINKIKAALRRMDEGDYGECEMCGEDIGIARLRARPVTTFCIRCKTKLENQEKIVIGS